MNVVIIALLLLNAALAFLLLARRSAPGSAERVLRDELRAGREEAARSARDLREEVSAGLKSSTDTMTRTLGEMGAAQKGQLETIAAQFHGLIDASSKRMETLRQTVETQLRNLQESNEKRLDQMRRTVDEQLKGTLETGLAERFKLVQSHLEAVHKGLGEMRSLADGVGDLKRVLSNVKTRGTFGEVQLGAILEQLLAPDQYERNVRVDPARNEAVEYAVKLPGRDETPGSFVWLPVDAKFPMEEYVRLQDAAERADAEGVRDAAAGIARSVRQSAARIRDKYLGSEGTIDFGIMFLPTEGLYAEVMRQPGLAEQVQRECHVVIAGPTTFAAILTSLRVGFRTLAIQKHSTEVWRVLSAVKAEFERFGELLGKLRRQIEIAASTVDETEKRRRMMDRKLRDVERLPAGDMSASAGPEGPGTLRVVEDLEEATADTVEDVMEALEGDGGRS